MEKIKKMLLCSSSINWSYVKARMKKYSSCNWPEITTYCGCCTVPHGIYIRSVINAIVILLTLTPNAFFLRDVMTGRDIILAGNMSLIEAHMEWGNGEFPDRATILAVCNALIAYYIAWISLRGTYILFTACTMYAVYAKHTRSLKIILYINVPFWFIELFLSIVNLFFIGFDIKIVMIIGHISELYNILAIRSFYMKLRGKSRLVPDALAIPTMTDTNSTIEYPYVAITNGKHCRTCTCSVRRSTLGSDVFTSTQPMTPPNVPTNEPPIIPIESNSVVDSVVTDEASVIEAHSSRQLNLDLPLSKIDLSDEPIIYDKAQLNVGSSPVLEDRCCTSV